MEKGRKAQAKGNASQSSSKGAGSFKLALSGMRWLKEGDLLEEHKGLNIQRNMIRKVKILNKTT